jgi:NADH:ubiquinone oxidoreductase subunit F (NADH-binding)
MATIIDLLQRSGLKGRGGANFPTYLKWQAVADAVEKNPEHKSFVICNGAEGEPGFFKDAYILEHHPEILIAGIKLALDTFQSERAIIYLRKTYYQQYRRKLEAIIAHVRLPISLFAETGGYLCGEETTLLETLEGRLDEPRLRPPFPTSVGYQGYPTLVSNLETFYDVYLVSKGEYAGKRFYSLSGDLQHPGVYELPESYSVRQVLMETGNLPTFKYFVQVGGGASGEIYTDKELTTAQGGSIIVYDRAKTDPLKLMKQWIKFFHQENCGKCAPCREGVRRIKELLEEPKLNTKELRSILATMRDTSFCPLGKSVYYPFNSLLEKIK